MSNNRPKFDIGGLLREQWTYVEQSGKFTAHQQRMLKALSQCRTAALGGHLDACTDCGLVRVSYNSCRNRHCPKCQGRQREAWIRNRLEEVLPVPYFHVVFTIPSALNEVALRYPKVVYNTLFRASWATLKTFGEDEKQLGARLEMIAVLHTWGQNLSLHPHLHCIVLGGGLTRLGRWKMARSEGKFLFPVRAMSLVFRAKFVALLRKAIAQGKCEIEDVIFKKLFQKKWVVYAKRPFGGPQQVIEYLGRYTHKVAISNHRILKVTETHVVFGYKDYREGGKRKVMQLTKAEFIRRFAMHILPSGFMKIRHYGILASRYKQQNLDTARRSLASDFGLKTVGIVLKTKAASYNPLICPCCGTPTMRTVQILPPQRAPPDRILHRLLTSHSSFRLFYRSGHLST